MTRRQKAILYVVGIPCLFAAMVSAYSTIKTRAVASLVARARYAVNIISATESQTNQIPESVAQDLADIIRRQSNLRVFYQTKCVWFGSISLLDADMKPIVLIDVLDFPLFNSMMISLNFIMMLLAHVALRYLNMKSVRKENVIVSVLEH